MQKYFDEWNKTKKEINSRESVIYFHNRDIWMMQMGINIGFEQDGKGKNFQRPVLVLKKLNTRFFIGVPLTKRCENKKHKLALLENKNSSFLILSQIRAFDVKRLVYRMERISQNRFDCIKQKIREYL